MRLDNALHSVLTDKHDWEILIAQGQKIAMLLDESFLSSRLLNLHGSSKL